MMYSLNRPWISFVANICIWDLWHISKTFSSCYPPKVPFSTCSSHQFTNYPIHQNHILFMEIIIYLIVFFELKSSNFLWIFRGHQNAFHSIIKIIITTNFEKKYSCIGENKLVNSCNEQIFVKIFSWIVYDPRL